MVWVDTSGFYALLDTDDPHHRAATELWRRFSDDEAQYALFTCNYTQVETMGVLQRRMGVRPVRRILAEFFPAAKVMWVTPEVHDIALIDLLEADRRKLSMVDCVSFVLMRSIGITDAFAFDPHFAEQGFTCLRA
jgi:uncharacterized protein